MTRLQDELVSRKEKLELLLKSGIDPYPEQSQKTNSCLEAYEGIDLFSKEKKTVILAGRIRSIRTHGAIAFGHLEDESGRIQIALRRSTLGTDKMKFWLRVLDIGDFVEIKGRPFRTLKNEPTIDSLEIKILAKSLRPLPEKWHGLSDVEVRFRKRYLDLLSNKEIKKIFLIRSKILRLIRDFLNARGFLEVETPILQKIPGGAAARPFITHHNALDTDLYLRVAPELYLKKLIVGGFEKIFEIGRCFRNEGIDREHSPEFTMLEFYWAYATYEDLINLTEELITYLLRELYMSDVIEHEGIKLEFKLPLKRVTFRDILKKNTSIDIDKASTYKSLREEIGRCGLKIESKDLVNYGTIVEALYKEFVRPKIIQPTFLLDFPYQMIPLAKRKRKDRKKISTFQLIVKGMEVCKAYNEENDPSEQRRRLKEQQALFEQGLQEAMRIDEDFVEALEHGMPPTAGFGMGIDRLTMLLTGVHSLKETVLFPTLK